MPDSTPSPTPSPTSSPGPGPGSPQPRAHRPLLVLGGYRAPRASPRVLLSRLVRYAELDPARVHLIAYPLASDLQRIARRVRAETYRHFPGPDPSATEPLDVVAISMGGLAARMAASAASDETEPLPRLNIRRLFTLATPHRGAILARFIRPDRAARAMKPGSDTLRALDAELQHADYQLRCYAHDNDRWVGTARCAPPGHQLHTLKGPPVLSHFSIALNDALARTIAEDLRSPELRAGIE